MAATVRQLMNFLAEMNLDALVGIDDGGTVLEVWERKEPAPVAYYEIGSVPEMFPCVFCGRLDDAAAMHLHGDALVGDCCWDDRLKASE